MKRWIGRVLTSCAGCIPPCWVEGFLRFHTLHLAERAVLDKGLRVMFRYADAIDQAIDKAAMRREGGVHPKHRLMQYARFFTGRIRTGERVLDIGCGVGVVASRLAEAGAIVTGIDIEPEKIAVASRLHRHPHLRFVCGDATRWLPDERFRVIVLSNVLEHLTGRPEFLGKLQEHLQPRCFLIRVPQLTRNWTVLLRRELGLPYYGDASHQIEYTMETFLSEIEQAGLAVTHIESNWGEIWAEVCKA